MSLLLEALKKAEKAKEEAQRRARESSGAESRLEGEAAGTAAPKPVLTRDQLPSVSQPLEIVSEDIAPQAREEPRQAPAPRVEPSLASQPEMRARDPQAADRAAAKRVFEAKFKEPNPKLPFFITMGVLGVFALGTVGYFWYQLRPPPPLVSAPPSNPRAVAAAPSAPSVPAAPPAIPGLPATVAAAPAAPVPAPAPPQAASPSAPPAAAPRARPAPRAAASRPPVREQPGALNVSRPAPQVHPSVAAGYAAYLEGDLPAARRHYQEALRDEPANRDALLGLAAIDVRSGRYEAAEARYLRLVQADPRDPHAQAALISLRAGRIDPLAAESRVKSLLAAEPNAHVLNFTLGNQFAQQRRWAEAQQEYFRAHSAEPENADFAYNLAVSLDHLRQLRLAREYYERAIALARAHGASFDIAAAETRVAQLGN